MAGEGKAGGVRMGSDGEREAMSAIDRGLIGLPNKVHGQDRTDDLSTWMHGARLLRPHSLILLESMAFSH